ncbi:septation ring formation regulator EzrA [Pontibacillus salicampi]|uniref:Septation ring formation regulator EzrA n=1 Tax=Pontibacillus salicampi TaxID=1449801 RepID=A0ABV6LIU4_9BACI
MEYVIAVLLAMVVVVIYGLILRKKVYDQVDRLEYWKLDISNRNVTEELSKVKNLNLSGETQDRFEKWRSDWDDILSRQLPDLEEGLFYAEEHADRYRFRKANGVLKDIEQSLQSIEQSIDAMLEELDTLLNSEQNSRENVELIEPQIKELKKKLLQQRYMFGKAEAKFEEKISEAQQQMASYYQLVEYGNYFEAYEMVESIKLELDTLQEKIEAFPELYKLYKRDLPDQLEQLNNGIKEMKENGFRIDHYGFEEEVLKYQQQIDEYVESLENAELEEAQSYLPELENRIQEMYTELEKEAVAKSYVEKHQEQLLDNLTNISDDIADTKEEVEQLQNMYHVEDKDIEMYVSLEKWINKLTHQLEDIRQDINDDETSYITIRSKVESFSSQLQELTDQHRQYQDHLYTLRKGEREAKDSIHQAKQDLMSVYRKLQKSNIPGVPSYIDDVLEQSRASLMDVQYKIEDQPLDMTQVQSTLDKALHDVQQAKEQTDSLLDEAHLAEQAIQYGNRYRSKYPKVAAQLNEAEQAFRAYQYDEALRKASYAIEEIEPGAVERIKEIMNTPVG